MSLPLAILWLTACLQSSTIDLPCGWRVDRIDTRDGTWTARPLLPTEEPLDFRFVSRDHGVYTFKESRCP